MQTAIYSLFQRHELAKVKCLIVQVQPVLGPSRHLHILINDEDSHELREFASQRSPYIMVHCEGRNLGVAGGRNVLIARAAAAGAEFFVSCDSDIIYDAAYFDRLERAYERLSQQGERVGFLQSLLLDGRVLRDRLPGLERLADWSDVQRRLENGSALRKNIWQATIQALGEQASVSAVYHSGVSNPWRAHFGAPHDASLPAPWMAPGWQQDLLTAWPTLRSEPELLQRLLRAGEPIRIASSAGGVTAFHRSALEALGPYEELFNPFGYEDSELGLRSLLAGWHNFLVPGAVAIHDIFLGESNRTVLSHSRIGLLRGFEATLPSLGAPESEFVLRQSLWFPWRDLLKPIADEEFGGFSEIRADLGGGMLATGRGYTQGPDTLGLDMLTTALHEIGHVLGLEHLPEREKDVFPQGMPLAQRQAKAEEPFLHNLMFPTNLLLSNRLNGSQIERANIGRPNRPRITV